jgi:hypothetical protein
MYLKFIQILTALSAMSKSGVFRVFLNVCMRTIHFEYGWTVPMGWLCGTRYTQHRRRQKLYAAGSAWLASRQCARSGPCVVHPLSAYTLKDG